MSTPPAQREMFANARAAGSSLTDAGADVRIAVPRMPREWDNGIDEFAGLLDTAIGKQSC
ncbi:hypothetical protein ABZ412_27685 [Nocardia sp. NPDC005746]|uniref:hypothetical protein n=1 Tax=Nocardia sp. NPDC005746 TaxID=3157062 RepID=UPI0033F61E74